MKTFNRFNLIAALTVAFALAVIASPFAAFADNSYGGAMPSIMLLGVHAVSYNSATAEVNYSAGDSTYRYNAIPTVLVSYTNLSTGETETSTSSYMTGSAETQSFSLDDLQPSTEYSYEAILSFQGETIESSPATFTTTANPKAVATATYSSGNVSNSSPVIVEPNSSIATYNAYGTNYGTNYGAYPTSYSSNYSTSNEMTSSQAASYFNISTPTLTSVENAVGATAAKKAVLNTIETGSTVHSNGVILAMTDDQANVTKGDSFTYTITYRNTNAESLHDSILQVQLPSQYEYSDNDQNATYDDSANTVTFGLGTITSGETSTVTFDATATGSGSGTVIARANLSYDGGSVSATDTDHYSGGAKDILGASVFGAGFFPQTFFGWLVIALIIGAIVIIARRYVLAPKPATPAAAK